MNIKQINNCDLPLLPHSSHVLTGGILPLRIFEARYLRMLKESYQRESAFGMCMLNANGKPEENTHIYPIGTLVEILNFEKLDDGQLGITIKGIRPFTINSVTTEEDGLRVSNVNFLEPWEDTPLASELSHLIERLQELYLNYPDLAALYTDPEWNNASWLALRWLEVLPLSPKQKQSLLQHSSSQACIEFLAKSFSAQ
ncbi:MAG: LON peptidase substrate-binding domain-containing protein [Sinobacterium sp.]|nr:LON peptidase substrate-binding domain-containing protein [Sinobacterium sp.]